MSKEPEKLVCDWCKKPIDMKEGTRYEVKSSSSEEKPLDCCSNCFKNIKPKEQGQRRMGLSFGG